MAKKVVLAGACRTAIGTMGGTLSTTLWWKLGGNRHQRGSEQGRRES